MVAVSALGGVMAAAWPLLVCLGVGLVGWFLTDAGAHGTPTGAMGIGAAGWLLAHGSAVSIAAGPGPATVVTMMPLGLTLVCAWTAFRTARRVGEAVSGHGPDADMLSDGARDWTVPSATGAFAVGYLLVAAVALWVSSGVGTSPVRTVLGCLALCALAAVPGIAVGSGRAALWAAGIPRSLLAAGAACSQILRLHLLASALVLLLAIAFNIGDAATVLSRLHTDTGDAILLIGLCLLLVPNAAVFTGSYLLGPGFAVGTATVVSPAAVALGPLPMFPLMAVLPDDGPGPGWAGLLLAVPALMAGYGALRASRRHPTTRWEQGALRACAGGLLAAVCFTVLAWLAGGAIGPGRMQDTGPFLLDTLVAGITWLGLGSLLGGLLGTYLHRRRAAA